MSFKVFALIGLVIILVTLASYFKELAQIFLSLIEAKTRKLFLFLILISTLTGFYVASVNFPDEDDSLYVPPAIQSLTYPDRAMSFELNWIVPSYKGIKFKAYLSGLATGIQYFWATVSYWTGLKFLNAYQIVNSYF